MADIPGRHLPKNRDELVGILQESIQSASDPSVPEANEEHLALLSMGDLDTLGESDRRAMLEAIAANPDLAQIVTELRADGWGSEKKVLNDPAVFALRAASWLWAAAACLLIAAGLWRLASPPVSTQPQPTQQAQLAAPNPPAQVQPNPANAGNPIAHPAPMPAPANPPAPTPPPPTPEGYRLEPTEIALIIAAAILVLTAVPAAIWIRFKRLRRRPRV